MFKKSRKRLNKSERAESSGGEKEQEESDAESQVSGVSKRSRKLTAQSYWTRVLSVSHRPIDFEEKFSIEDDLE